jgi:hypothetical protein
VCYLPGVSSVPARLSDLDLRAPAYIPNEQRKAVGITARRCIDERCYDRYLGDIVHVFTNRCPLLTIPFGNDLPTVYQTLLREREPISGFSLRRTSGPSTASLATGSPSRYELYSVLCKCVYVCVGVCSVPTERVCKFLHPRERVLIVLPYLVVSREL